MPGVDDGEARRLNAMRAVVSLAFLGSLALSQRAWVGERLYPRLPALDVPLLGAPGELALTAALLACLAACALGVRPRASGALAAGFVTLLVLDDVTRLQPWVYCWTAALLVLSCDAARARERLLLLVGVAYAHSALSKLGDGFASGPFAFILSPFVAPNSISRPALLTLAGLSIAAELAGGLLLLVRRTRVVAACGLVGMHVALLLSLGPLGSNWNAVVWPWNLGLALLLPLLAFDGAQRVQLRGNWTLAVVFGLCPLLRPLGWWDHYASFALYSGDKPNGVVYMSAEAHAELPQAVRAWAHDDVDGYRLSLKTWSLGELGVPPYPEQHAYRAALRRFLAAHPNPHPMQLEITVPAVYTGATRVRRTTY
jgi:hypothetical protein